MFANSQPIKSEQTVWLAPNLELRHVEKVPEIEKLLILNNFENI